VAAYNVDLANHVDELAAEAARRRAAVQQRNVAYHAKIGEARDLHVGDVVMIHNNDAT
jgi:hypothetical protein